MEPTTNNAPPAATYNLALTLDQINVIMAGIGELPTKIGLPLTEEIRKQIIPQLPSAPEA
jgi:hypothetical protein